MDCARSNLRAAAGTAFAHRLARANIPAIMSNSRGPDSLAGLHAEIAQRLASLRRLEAAGRRIPDIVGPVPVVGAGGPRNQQGERKARIAAEFPKSMSSGLNRGISTWSSKSLLAFGLCGLRQGRPSSRPFRFLGLPQDAEALHVLANLDALPLHISHRPRTFFRGQSLPVGARDAFGRRFSRSLTAHLLIRIRQKQSPLDPQGLSGHIAISVHP